MAYKRGIAVRRALEIAQSVLDDNIAEPVEEKKKDEKPVYRGYCTSYKCCEDIKMRKLKSGKEKVHVKYSDRVFRTENRFKEICQFCGNFLFWQREMK